jgi:N-acetylneuraminic acid mutarotase
MGESAKSSGDKPPRSPVKARVVRSQKIMATSPTMDPAADVISESPHAERPPLPRSHTPGHLSTRSQDRRRKPSELSIRQRSQSAAVHSPAASSSQSLTSTSKTPVSAHSTTNTTSAATTPKPLTLQTNIPNGGAASGSATESASGKPPESAEGRDNKSDAAASSKRPAGLRSTSAIAGKASGAGGAPPSHRIVTTQARTQRGEHIPFPPLQDPKTAPDVPAAPASGMYWSRAPVSGAAHTSLRAHTTTLIGSNVYIFGGCDSRACFNELYVFDADSFYWSTPYVVGDVPVPLRAMTCTAVGKKLVIFGGGDGPAYYNDVYVLDTANFRWSRPRIIGDRLPSKRRAHTACFYKNGIYVFGGGDGVRALNDIWRLDVSDVNKMSWRCISPSSPSSDNKSPSGSSSSSKDGVTRPKARGYHTANMVGSKLIVFGGSDGGECFNDVWVYDVDTHVWKAVNIPVTYRRLSHTATIVGSYLFVVGGHDGNEYSNEVLLLNLVTMQWDRRKIYGLPPSGRGYHGTVLYDSRLLVIGGFDGSEVFGDVWLLELAVHAYYSQISHFTIEV